MRQNVIAAVKTEIEELLATYLRDEGIELLDAATPVSETSPLVLFEGIEDLPLEGTLLHWEIRVLLSIFGKPWQCEALADGIYIRIAAYQPTATELTAILTSLHVEAAHYGRMARRATIRCVIGKVKRDVPA